MNLTEAAGRKTMSLEEFLALSGDGYDRDLILGEVWERPMTRRNKYHSFTEANLVYLLRLWVNSQPQPRGRVVSGEAGFDMSPAADTLVGIDIAYATPETVAATPENAAFFFGVPLLAVEILSPSDSVAEVGRKIEVYNSLRVVVWKVDPYDETVGVYRLGRPPEYYNVTQELDGGPDLPGFRVAVAEIFS